MLVGDTLRADRLGSYGSARNLSPFLDSLARRSAVFRNAYATSSWTNPSVASLFTSRYPSQHGVISFESVLSQEEVTLAEALREAGYATAFFSPNGVLREGWGYEQGFDEFAEFAIPGIAEQPDHLRLPYRADYTNRHALAWLDSLSASGATRPPVFLYIQYMEPHSPYAPRKDALERVLGGRKPPDLDEVNRFAFLGNDVAVDDRVLRDLRDVYDAEVLSLDTELRRLFHALGSRGLLENAIVVVTSDHGEEFKEHGLLGHEKTLFGEVTRVPLLIALPGRSEGAEIAEAVSLVDLAPTLFCLIGRPVPASFEGRSLLSRAGRGLPARRCLQRADRPRDRRLAALRPASAQPRQRRSQADRRHPRRDGVLRPEGGSGRARARRSGRDRARRAARADRSHPAAPREPRRAARGEAARRGHPRADPRARLRPLSRPRRRAAFGSHSR